MVQKLVQSRPIDTQEHGGKRPRDIVTLLMVIFLIFF
jgi:hypothetical protein